MGKDWAKGLSARTDPRVAGAGRTTLPLEWSSEMAYVVGLTATDGCLYTGARKLNFKSSDRDLVATYLGLLGRTNRIHDARARAGGIVYFTDFHDAALYEWFRSVGLSPRKSLTIGAIDVPDPFLMPLARGLLDGDGSIVNKRYRADTGRRSDYYWEYLITSFNSASRRHLEWLQERIAAATGIRGYVAEVRPRDPRPNRHPYHTLRYGKGASTALLPLLYAADAPCLDRKRRIWRAFAECHGNPLG